MSVPEFFAWFWALSWKWKLLAFATTVVLIEVAFRRLAPDSLAYEKWTRFFQGIGVVWTAVILAFVYIFSVGPVGLGMRLLGKDPLDRGVKPEPSFWRAHEPNPLGPEQASRHQF